MNNWDIGLFIYLIFRVIKGVAVVEIAGKNKCFLYLGV
jgi:hypothetical protein